MTPGGTRLACSILLLLMLPALPQAAPRALSEHLFPSAEAPISEFARRRAAQTGQPPLTQEPGAMLHAELSLPAGDGPFPVVMMFPRCGGWRGVVTDWPERLNQWGYATLKIFSIAARPERDDPCNTGRVRTVGNTEMVFDAVGAMRYLQRVAGVDASRVAVMGWGVGATAALKLVNWHGFARLFAERAAAAIAFYPACELHSEFLAPTLVLIGERDRTHPPLFCREMQRLAAPGSPPFEIRAFADLGHDFDLLAPLPAAQREQMENAVWRFLRQHL